MKITVSDPFEIHEIPFAQRTAAVVEQHYFREFPILRAYVELVQ